MDEDLQRQILQQLKVIKFWLSFFGLLLIATLAIMGYLAFRVLAFMHDTTNRIESFQRTAQENLNFRDKVCSDTTASRIIKNNTSICK
jgi:hypothetical protein